MAFIRTSGWEAHDVTIGTKGTDGSLRPVERGGKGEMSRDLSIGGILVKEGGALLHRMDKGFVLKPNECVVLETREHITTGPKVLGLVLPGPPAAASAAHLEKHRPSRLTLPRATGGAGAFRTGRAALPRTPRRF